MKYSEWIRVGSFPSSHGLWIHIPNSQYALLGGLRQVQLQYNAAYNTQAWIKLIPTVESKGAIRIQNSKDANWHRLRIPNFHALNATHFVGYYTRASDGRYYHRPELRASDVANGQPYSHTDMLLNEKETQS